MYGTSDIRKGLKVLMDGNPYNIIEFQFVKPGKGAAFTRTKFKNLLTGAVVERNIRSGEKLEPANVETRDMQFLYKEGGDLVFMDQTNYEQVTISTDLVGEAHDLMTDNLPCTAVFFNDRHAHARVRRARREVNLAIRRGRVLAVDGDRGTAIVRGERGDARVPAPAR